MRSERGQSLALIAAFMLFVGLPVLILVIDGTRLYRVRSLLQAATDAACEDAAITAPDFEYYKSTGEKRFVSNQFIWYQAYGTFQQALHPNGAAALEITSPTISIVPDRARSLMDCSSSVNVPLIMVPLTVTINTSTASAIRFSSP
ncbi:MAG: pilus assembly protein TadG-related protein [Chloroflexota bacterium]|nr:pilus assembly protein TadG-related protein [Chloroflexota bacterium]